MCQTIAARDLEDRGAALLSRVTLSLGALATWALDAFELLVAEAVPARQVAAFNQVMHNSGMKRPKEVAYRALHKLPHRWKSRIETVRRHVDWRFLLAATGLVLFVGLAIQFIR